MMFMIHFEIDPDHREKSTERLRTGGPGLPENVKPVGIWHSVTLLEGWAIVETDDANALAKHMHYWTDLNINHITPVLSPEEVLAVSS